MFNKSSAWRKCLNLYFDCFDQWEHSELSPPKTIYQEASFSVQECFKLIEMETKAIHKIQFKNNKNLFYQNTIYKNTIDQNTINVLECKNTIDQNTIHVLAC